MSSAGLGIGDAGCVDRERERPELGLGPRNRVPDRLGARHVCGHGDAPPAGGGNEVGGPRQSVVAAPVEQRHVRAALGEPHGDALANAAACARHQRHVAGQIKELSCVERDILHDFLPPQLVASSMTETSFASARSRMPACLPWARTTIRFDTPKHFLEIGADDDYGDALLRQPDDDVVDRRSGADVDAAGRLVEDDHARVRARATWRSPPFVGCRRTGSRRAAPCPFTPNFLMAPLAKAVAADFVTQPPCPTLSRFA